MHPGRQQIVQNLFQPIGKRALLFELVLVIDGLDRQVGLPPIIQALGHVHVLAAVSKDLGVLDPLDDAAALR